MPRNNGRKSKNNKKKKQAIKQDVNINEVEELEEESSEIMQTEQNEEVTEKEIKTKKDSKSKKETKKKKHFFKDFKAELKRVVWPTPKQLVNNVVAVLVIVVIMAILIFLLDLTFESMNKYGINKLKEVINPENSISNTVNNTTDDNSIYDLDENTLVNNSADEGNQNVEQ